MVEADRALQPLRLELEQEVEGLLGDHLLGPARGELGAARELLEREVPAHGEVVVAAQALLGGGDRELDAGVGIGAVADEVAQAPDPAHVVAGHVLEHGLERVPVAVDVGEHRDPHRFGTVSSRGVRRRWPVALVAAFAAAELAVLLLRPRGVLAPADVDVHRYFTEAQLERARDFNRPQLVLFGAQLAIQIGVLSWLVLRPPAALRRLDRRPLLGGAAAGAGLSLTLTVATLPLAAISHQRAKNVGLATQDWGAWLGDVARSAGLGLVLGALGGLLAMALIRRFPRRWWIPGSAAVVAIGALFVWAGPVLLDPIFNSFTKVPPGKVRSEVLDLAKRADVHVGQVYVSDASRRTTGYNAYVTGVGASKRVVLYDTLVKGATDAERRLVVAHELGHVHYRDVPHGLLYLLLVAPFGTWAVFVLSRRFAPDVGVPSALPAVVLALGLVATPMTWISNSLSRTVEARADQFSLRLTHEPRAAIALERRLSVTNVDDPDPPGWVTAVLGTHPPTIDRIGQAVAFERGEGR